MAYTYDGCCGSCIYMNTNDYTGHKDHCYCTYRKQYYNLTESKCRYYKYDPNKDYYDLNHRWHIVSVVFNKLQLKDSYECIALLHNFRTNFLEKDSRYDSFLEEYDKLGPIIAKCIDEDEDSQIICQRIVQSCLSFMLDFIRNGKNQEALYKYLEMFDTLKEIYSEQIDEYIRVAKV